MSISAFAVTIQNPVVYSVTYSPLKTEISLGSWNFTNGVHNGANEADVSLVFKSAEQIDDFIQELTELKEEHFKN